MTVGAGCRRILKSARMLSVEIHSEVVVVLLLAALLSLYFHYLHEDRENRIICVRGLEEWVADRF